MQKSLDQKIADIRANPSGSKAFIIADAKDADMAFGITAPGQKRPLNPERVLKSEICCKTPARPTTVGTLIDTSRIP